jgi:hypothetical protein
MKILASAAEGGAPRNATCATCAPGHRKPGSHGYPPKIRRHNTLPFVDPPRPIPLVHPNAPPAATRRRHPPRQHGLLRRLPSKPALGVVERRRVQRVRAVAVVEPVDAAAGDDRGDVAGRPRGVVREGRRDAVAPEVDCQEAGRLGAPELGFMVQGDEFAVAG